MLSRYLVIKFIVEHVVKLHAGMKERKLGLGRRLSGKDLKCPGLRHQWT